MGRLPVIALALILGWALFSSALTQGWGCFGLVLVAFVLPHAIGRRGTLDGADRSAAASVWLFQLGAVFAVPLLPMLLGIDGFYLSVALLHSTLIYFAWKGELRCTRGQVARRVTVARVLLCAWAAWTLGSTLRGYFAYLPLDAPVWTPGFLGLNSLGFESMTAPNHPLLMGLLRIEVILFGWMGLELTLAERGREAAAFGGRIARCFAWATVIGFSAGALEIVVASVWRGDSSVLARLASGLGRNHRPLLDHNALGTAMVLLLPLLLCAGCIGLWKLRGKTECCGHSLEPSPRWHAALGPLAFALGAGLLVTSRSKSALAGFGLSVVLLCGMLGLQIGGRIRALFLAGLGLCVVLVAGLNFAPDSLVDSISSSRYGHDLVRVVRLDAASDYIAENRSLVWENTKAVAAEHPLVGVGLGRLPLLLAEHHDPGASGWFNPLHENAHSQYLQVLAEEGWLGLALFSCILLMGLAGAWSGRAGTAVFGTRLAWRFAGVAALGGVALNLAVGHALLVPSVAVLFMGVLGWLLAGPSLTGVSGAPSTPSNKLLVSVGVVSLALALLPLWLPGGRRPLARETISKGAYPWEFQALQTPDRAHTVSDDARWFETWGNGSLMKVPVQDVRDARFEGTTELTLTVFAPGSDHLATEVTLSLPHLTQAEALADPSMPVNPTAFFRVPVPKGIRAGDLVELHLRASSHFNGSRLFSTDYRRVAARLWPPFFRDAPVDAE